MLEKSNTFSGDWGCASAPAEGSSQASDVASSPSFSQENHCANQHCQPMQWLTPFQRKLLQQALKSEIQPKYRQRIEIMLLADIGYSQSQICAELGCCQETARYWVNVAKNGQAHQWNQTPIGRPKKTSENYQQRLKDIIRSSPQEYGYAFSQWTAQWLSRHLAKEFGIEYSTRHIYRLLKKMGLSKKQRKLAATKAQHSQHKIAIGQIKPLQPNNSSSISVSSALEPQDTNSQIFDLYPI